MSEPRRRINFSAGKSWVELIGRDLRLAEWRGSTRLEVSMPLTPETVEQLGRMLNQWLAERERELAAARRAVRGDK